MVRDLMQAHRTSRTPSGAPSARLRLRRAASPSGRGAVALAAASDRLRRKSENAGRPSPFAGQLEPGRNWNNSSPEASAFIRGRPIHSAALRSDAPYAAAPLPIGTTFNSRWPISLISPAIISARYAAHCAIASRFSAR